MTNTTPDSDTKDRIINDYLHTDLKVVDVAKKHNISIPTLVDLLRQSNIARRSRGRRLLAGPLPRAQQILSFAVAHGFSRAAEHFKISRQRVSGLARRWGVVASRSNLQSRTLEVKSEAQKPTRNRRRELVICFRLRADELSLLRKSLPQSVTQATRSPHRLVRAAVLGQLENVRMLQQSQKHQSIVAPGVVALPE
jgi:hypothetical protein